MRSLIVIPVVRSCSPILAVIGIALTSAVPASAQQLAGWAGSIRCELQAQAQGYSHQETQTWTLTGAPTVQGSVTAYPATWTVVGAGQHDRTRLSSRRVAAWTANVAGVAAPIGFTQHALGRTFDVSKWHAQLTRGGGYTGTDQFFNDGVPASSQPLAMTVYEWQFPKIEAAITETKLEGSNTTQVRAFLGPLQPGEAVATVTCTWSLARGSVPPPLPPSTMPPAGTASGGTTPAGTPPPGTAPGGTTTPGTSTTAGGTAPAGTTPPNTGTTAGGTAPVSTVPAGTAPVGAAGRPPAGGAAIVTDVPGGTLTKDAPTSDLWTVANGVTGPWIKGQPAQLGGRMRNLGPVSVTGAILTVTMPPSGFSITQMQCSGPQDGPPVPCPTIAQLANGFATPTLAPGRQFRIDISGTVTGDVGSSLSFAMTGRAPAGVYDPDSTNNGDGDTVVIGGP